MPTKEQGWVGSFTIPRVLKMDEEGMLLQQPAEELKALRKNENPKTVIDSQVLVRDDFEFGEVKAEFQWEEGTGNQEIWLRVSDDYSEKTIVGIDPKNHLLYVDRSASGEGDQSRIEMPIKAEGNSYPFSIFLDRSSLEIFAEDGKKTLTTRIYPDENSVGLVVDTNEKSPVRLTMWELEDRMKEMKIHS